MNLLNKKQFCISLILGLWLAGCDTSDYSDYNPTEPVPNDNWGVYFDADNESEFVREPDDEPILEIKIRREKTEGALTVPLEMSQVKGEISAPETVTFADGESEQTIRLTYAGFPEVKPSAVISVPESYINPYKEKKGFCSQRVELVQTEIIVKAFSLVDGTDYQSTTMFTGAVSQIKWFVGKNKFIYTNFFGSGIDLLFKIDVDHGGTFDANNINKCGGGIVPLFNNIEDEYGWYLTPDKKPTVSSQYAKWTPAGTNKSVTDYIFFYNYYNGYSYCTIYLDQQYDSGACGFVDFFAVVMDDTENLHYFSYLTFTEKYK